MKIKVKNYKKNSIKEIDPEVNDMFVTRVIFRCEVTFSDGTKLELGFVNPDKLKDYLKIFKNIEHLDNVSLYNILVEDTLVNKLITLMQNVNWKK